jgi:hypothetical protein
VINNDSPPLSIPTISVRAGSFSNSLTTGRKIMDCTKNGTSVFDGHNYAFWNRRMKTFFQAQGFYVWKLVVYGYTTPATPPIDKYGKKNSEKNSRAMNSILSGLASSLYIKVMHKVVDYRSYGRNGQERNVYVAPYNIEFYKCHNYGHISHDCRSMIDTSMKENIDIICKKVWKRKK